MLEEMKKLCLAAVGAAAITYDKTIDIINDLVEKGKITVEVLHDIIVRYTKYKLII